MPQPTFERPLISFALFTYNQEQFVREAVAAAFAQTYSPLEIILSDDSSKDSTFNIISEMVESYRGPHRVIVNRNPTNIGIGAHVNKVMGLMSADILVVAAGDDVSLPQRTEVLAEIFLDPNRRAVSVYSDVTLIDAAGKELSVRHAPAVAMNSNLEYRVKNNCPGVQGASHAWRRSIFSTFGQLQDSVIAEDRTIAFRAYELGEVAHVNQPLVKYRTHDFNVSQHSNAPKSLEEHIVRCQKLARMTIASYDQFLKDMEHPIFAMNHEKKSLSNAKKLAQRIKTENEMYLDFVSANRKQQMYVLGRSLVKGVNFRRLGSWAARWCFPGIYKKALLSRFSGK